MNVVFRCDSALFIGSGHVLRCLSLAFYLKSHGHHCIFVSRSFGSDLIDLIRKNGFVVHSLPYSSSSDIDTSDRLAWLGIDFAIDAFQTISILKGIKCDVLVVDHYGIDEKWESLVSPYVDVLIVVDDLANRPHQCNILVDQNYFNNMNSRYTKLVSSSTMLCLGPGYALVRPQFRKLRSRSLSRRRKSISIKNILISLGGSDPDNLTQHVLASIPKNFSDECNINVVVGALYPHISSLKRHMDDFKSIKLRMQTDMMHSLMYYSDLAITSGGSITWEKFTLGLPSFVVPSDHHEAQFSLASSSMGAQVLLSPTNSNFKDSFSSALETIDSINLLKMSSVCSSLCDGNGVASVYDKINLFKSS